MGECARQVFSWASALIFFQSSVLPVPIVKQTTEYSCAPATLSAVLAFHHRYYSEGSLIEALGTSKINGTAIQALAPFAKQTGLSAEFRDQVTLREIENEISARRPVIVEIQAWAEDPDTDYSESWEEGHFVAVVGVSSTHVDLMDPYSSTGRTRFTREEFSKRWHTSVRGKRFHEPAVFIGR